MAQTIAAVIAGLGCVLASAWGWRHAARLADTWRDRQAPIYGSKLAARTYTARNIRWGIGGGFLFGLALIAMAASGAFNY